MAASRRLYQNSASLPDLPPLHLLPEAELLLCLFSALAVRVRQDVTALLVINVLF